jgi:hypothetical protein
MFSLGHCPHAGLVIAMLLCWRLRLFLRWYLVYPPGNYSLAWCPAAMPCVVVPRSKEISTTSAQQAVDTFSQGVKMRGKSAFEATQPPLVRADPPAIAPLGETEDSNSKRS